MDILLDGTVIEVGYVKREALYKKVQTIVTEEIKFLGTGYSESIPAMKKDVGGIML